MVHIFHFEKKRMSEGKKAEKRGNLFFLSVIFLIIILTLEDFGWLKL